MYDAAACQPKCVRVDAAATACSDAGLTSKRCKYRERTSLPAPRSVEQAGRRQISAKVMSRRKRGDNKLEHRSHRNIFSQAVIATRGGLIMPPVPVNPEDIITCRKHVFISDQQKSARAYACQRRCSWEQCCSLPAVDASAIQHEGKIEAVV